jgi:hypothetical protein
MDDLIIHKTGLIIQDPATAIARAPAADHDAIRAALQTLKGSADLSNYISFVLNQGMTSTCWAHSAAALKYVRDAITTGRAELVSPLFFAQTMYGTYRAAQTPAGDTLPLLQDTGAQLDDAARCFAKWGTALFGPAQQDGGTDVPATEDAEGNPIPLPETTVALVETGATKPFGGEYDITPNDAAIDTACACLEAKTPIWLGGLVGENLQRYVAGTIEQPCPTSDPTAGGHARAVLGYRVVAGKVQFKILNSWGLGWGDAGYSWAAAEVLSTAWALLPFEVQ